MSPPTEVSKPCGPLLARSHTNILGGSLLALGIIGVYLLFSIWPESDVPNGPTWPEQVRFAGIGTMAVRPERHALFLVIVSAVLGSLIHASTSFAYYVANRRAEASWTWWYLLRLPIGVSLAVILYFALRAGVLNSTGRGGDGVEAVNPFGIATIAGLVGMFSKQATDKLADVFDTLFTTDKSKVKVTTQTVVTSTDPGTSGGP